MGMGLRVLNLTKPAEGVQLLRWNKKLPSASTQDPLGLNLRLSARLATQLLYCITSITPRARYYARFFPWAFQDYAENEKGKRGDPGSVRAVLSRERAVVLGAVLHHDGAACEGGALGGSNKATELVNSRARQSYNSTPGSICRRAKGNSGRLTRHPSSISGCSRTRATKSTKRHPRNRTNLTPRCSRLN